LRGLRSGDSEKKGKPPAREGHKATRPATWSVELPEQEAVRLAARAGLCEIALLKMSRGVLLFVLRDASATDRGAGAQATRTARGEQALCE